MAAQSVALTIFVLAGNTLLRPLVNAIDRIPLNERTSEATYEISVTTDSKRAGEARDLMNERLEAASYPVRETRIVFHSNDNVEVSAILVPLSVEPDDLDKVVADLSKMPGVNRATWHVSALE
jgi:putative Mg2+ transporter-C (MgtC) family protein